MSNEVHLLPLTQTVQANLLPSTARRIIFVADIYVSGAETWKPQPWGWQTTLEDAFGEVVIHNIDHHAAVPRMYDYISSGNLALEYVHRQGHPQDTTIFINHCDCDSVVSAAILAGLVPPDLQLGAAVIAADHTGAANDIADALQPLEAHRDWQLSLDTLRRLMADEPLDAEVERLRQERQAERRTWQECLLKSDTVYWYHGIALIEAERRVPAEMLTALLPEARLIVTAKPSSPGKWELKIRLGLAVSHGENLCTWDVATYDPAFGGRWNAGSNKRGGGTSIQPRQYVEELGHWLDTHPITPVQDPSLEPRPSAE